MYPHEAQVVVDTDALIARRWGQYSGEFGVLFVPRDPASVDSKAIRASLVGIRTGERRKTRPAVAPGLDGFAILLHPVRSRKALLTLLSDLRAALEQSGFEGVLRVGEDLLKKWRLTDIVPAFTVVACVSSAVLPMSEPPDYVFAAAGIGALADRIVGVQVPRQPRRGLGQKRRRRPLPRGLRDAQRILSAGPSGSVSDSSVQHHRGSPS